MVETYLGIFYADDDDDDEHRVVTLLITGYELGWNPCNKLNKILRDQKYQMPNFSTYKWTK